MDTFAQLIPDARAFLAELAANNTRDWFKSHKARYEDSLKTPATLLLDQIAHDIGRDSGITLSTKLFRPHRDVRFSKDKTPYQTHLHMMWTLNTSGRQNPCLFFGISPEYVTAGGGIMGFEKQALVDWRQAVAGPFGEELQGLLATALQKGLKPREPALKRIPSPYGPDHPQGELLRRKGLSLWREVDKTDFATPVKAIKQAYHDMRPVLDKLISI